MKIAYMTVIDGKVFDGFTALLSLLYWIPITLLTLNTIATGQDWDWYFVAVSLQYLALAMISTRINTGSVLPLYYYLQ